MPLESAKSIKLMMKYETAVKTIVEGNKLIVSGVGKSGFIARKIAATFSSIGKKAFFLHPVEALHGDIGMVEDGDVAILSL
jgi:arabinose-5-phosphate isomerase